ncbi:integrase family protein [Sphingomonas sp. S1-29]|uniref:tyrosine-type recombinase/integrase n=1 Tax=Sphingomonas sp. S1-29 TaxID=2991074 RepID=UPI00223EE30D|nr:integrase arm-type DNA-binding domain-containing protein [Sphingomonas sp. S1-29]UZK69567.1 integrase family protein [Sphingomonas sp. S1-29]
MAKKIPARPTARFIADLETRDKDYQIGDETVSNLFLLIRPTGLKRWTYDAANICNTSSRRIKMSLGTYPAYTLAEAREWADQLNRLRGRGIDPRIAKAEAEAEEARKTDNTLRTVHGLYIAHKKLEGLRTIDEKIRLMERNVFPQHGDRPIDDFTKSDARACVQVMRDRGAAGAANNMLAELQAFLRWAAAEDHVEHNVAASILKTGGGNPRRALKMHELVWLWRALDSYDADQADPIRLLILTGCRVMESHGAALAEIRNGIWTLPRERAKTKVVCELPLAPLAKSIFGGARERAMKRGWSHCFRSRPYRTMAHPMLSSLRNDLDRMAKLEGETVEPWDLHCIRHAVRTEIVAGDPSNIPIAERILNHATTGIVNRYDHNTYNPAKLKLLSAWEARIVAEVAANEERIAA